MRIAVIVGARPNFVKAAAVVPALRAAGITVSLINTGQHSDEAMAGQLFCELGVSPDVNLREPEGVTAAERFADMTLRLVRFFVTGDPYDLVVVLGDCDSTLAGALAAKKCGLRLAHVEAGLRASDAIQENLNRILVDHASDFLFVSEVAGLVNLRDEGLNCGDNLQREVHNVGNVMIDTLRKHAPERTNGNYALLTLHRAETVDTEKLWAAIACAKIVAKRMPVIWPLHPRTKARLAMRTEACGFITSSALGYKDFIAQLAGAKLVMTDSGGVQEEATALGVPCLTLREQTERPATISEGTNRLVSFLGPEFVEEAVEKICAGEWPLGRGPANWDGHAAERIAEILKN